MKQMGNGLKRYVLLVLVVLMGQASFSQIERINIETYYVTDAADATDTSGGPLEAGYKTYRIFVDLLPGSRLLAIYGEDNHPLVFSSTSSFFNHREEGISFGKDLSRTRFKNGTVPLDTYITLGQCSRSFAEGAYFGVPKDHDTDGSIVGGINNDGGSAAITDGLLTNDTDEIGKSLTEADGLVVFPQLPTSWINIGFIDLLTTNDTTMFGSVVTKSGFYSTNAVLRNSGVAGVDPEANEILVAQLTTKGEISFEINLEVETGVNGSAHIVNYVARNEGLGPNDVFSPLLKYPYTCGCTNPDYLEASTTFACTDDSKCLTPIVLGCMDSLACNYDQAANYNIQDLCCYIGYCNDRDISLVCPELRQREDILMQGISLYPNPAFTELFLDLDFVLNNDITYSIVDLYGKVVQQGLIAGHDKYIDISSLSSGYFALHLATGETIVTRPFVKL